MRLSLVALCLLTFISAASAQTAAPLGPVASGGAGGGAGNPCTTTSSSLQYDADGAFGCVSGITSDGTNIILNSGVIQSPSGGIQFSGSSSGVISFGTSYSLSTNTTINIPNPTTSTDTLALLGTAQTFTAAQTFTNSDLKLKGSSTGVTTFSSGNSSGTSYTLTIPAATGTMALISSASCSAGTVISSITVVNGIITAITGAGC